MQHEVVRPRLLLGLFVATTSALGWLFACSNTTFENASDAGALIESGVSSGDASTSIVCPSGQGPSMVQIKNQPFCIDSTEVTNAQYQAFLMAVKDGYVADAGAQCAWNTTFTSSTTADCATVGTATDIPVTCIDWCDAYSYCAWAGKHLCGATTSATAPLDVMDSVNPALSQWELACSGNGSSNYPYGDTYAATACNAPGVALANVGSFAGCVGGYAGIFDMAGNAAEWVDACEDGGSAGSEHDNCAELGDSYSNPHVDQNPGLCALRNYYPRSSTNPDVGFRCCAN